MEMSLEERMESGDHCAEEEGECYSWMDSFQGGKIKGDKKRRFSQEQIKSLESMFENQTKLEPRQKLQLAKDLGLQPRQVAIWFQNKRARWKSKQLERQYSSLRNDYDALLSSFESLKKEKQVLMKQLQSLSEQLELPSDRIKREDDREKADANSKNDPNAILSLKEEPDPKSITSSSDEDNKFNYFSEQDGDLYDCHLTSSLTSSATPQFCLQNSWSLENSSANSHWWAFWPPNE